MKQNGKSSQSRKKKRQFVVKNPRVEVEEAEKEEEERHWCCEWCDEIVEHLQEQIWQLHRREVEREEMWKNRFQQLEFFQKRIFQKVADFENVFSVRFKCQRTWLGCMMGWRV